MNSIIENKLKKIKCLICDVDGVLTNGQIYCQDDEKSQNSFSYKESKIFHVHDGFGLSLLLNAGIEVAIISAAKNDFIAKRMNYLGIKHCYLDNLAKDLAFDDLKNKLGFLNEEFAYIGDDLPDLLVMRQVGLSIAVANAIGEVKNRADFVTKSKGGKGAVREIVELILKAQGLYNSTLVKYLHELDEYD